MELAHLSEIIFSVDKGVPSSFSPPPEARPDTQTEFLRGSVVVRRRPSGGKSEGGEQPEEEEEV